MNIGDKYKHFKHGTIYEIKGFSRDSETQERRVLYKSITAPLEEDPWDRPMAMFFEMVEKDGILQKRFEKID